MTNSKLLERFLTQDLSLNTCINSNQIQYYNNNISWEDPYFSLPSAAAAPPGMILVIKMLGSSPICGLSAPPAMLNPSPVFPYNINKS